MNSDTAFKEILVPISCVKSTPCWEKSGKYVKKIFMQISKDFKTPLKSILMDPKVSETIFKKGKKNPTEVKLIVRKNDTPKVEGGKQRKNRIEYIAELKSEHD